MKRICLLVAIGLMLLPAISLAAPKVTMHVKAEKEVSVKKDGKETVQWVNAASISSGEVITYTVIYKNEGDEEATDVVIDDPIPTGTVYLPDSATGKGSDISFSIDKGKTYKKPSLLTYEVTAAGGKVEKRSASPDDYTHIRWVVKRIPQGQEGKLSFKVKVR